MRKVVSLAIITMALVAGCAVNPQQPAPATQPAATAQAPASQPAPVVAAPAPVLPAAQPAVTAPVAPRVAETSAAHVVCKLPRQQGCFDFSFPSAKYDSKNNILAKLPNPNPIDATGRINRATEAGMAVMKELMEGRAQAASPATTLLLMFGTIPVPAANMTARVVDSNKKVRLVPVEDVTGQIKNLPVSASGGAPTAVYRVRTEMLGSLLAPVTAFNDGSYFLLCPESKEPVYPNGAMKKGLGFMWANIKGRPGVYVPVVYKD